MKKTLLFATLLTIFLSCKNHKEEVALINSIEADTIKVADKQQPLNWKDDLLAKYVSQSDNDLIQSANKQKLNEEWLFDQEIVTDTASYLVYQIGHDVTDEGGTNPRFVTDQWVRIDTISKQLYEYDLANDSLIKWKP
ncbi:hypothetical protein [Flavobacterium subsaxonicum]|uniref:Lipoprotein n=1 Tax=Flavobacterium subsaxonicum WB 4.1-42 = DSM 21790 TaxID=1121898 RepID=A0A0A2MQA3_9FLAO|nr:hypothetical protein [Flavobacterium subsaxonicum]KGO94862.1 hypothetical protein Q766_01725 [Flavobacterium subsaxonicum WB 4.1-42 = DSM 21790]